MNGRSILAFASLLALLPVRGLKPEAETNRITVAFWNVYNLFDTIDDPLKKDEEFTPTGKFKWTEEKLAAKIKSLSAILEELDADIVGLAEVENIEVLRRLGLAAGYPYAYLIEREDARGIDVGILSRKALKDVRNSGSGRGYLLGTYRGITFAFTHWKSKLGANTGKKRLENASFAKNLGPPVLLLGDFNEDPNEPARKTLPSLNLINLIADDHCRSFVEKSKWICIDGAYANPGNCELGADAEIVRLPRMMRGKKPDLAFSDHFPVLAHVNSCDQGN
ncbi:MAG: endonuclease/exonuclease/phosphatase family protein [Spirochaetia bacterium]|nr:endonuclease/exonuclease/phosphatase family protein [Spirochaetia bacterium]